MTILNERKFSSLTVKGTTDKLTKTLKRKNFRVIFTPPNTIRKMVDSLKDPIDPSAYKGTQTLVHVGNNTSVKLDDP